MARSILFFILVGFTSFLSIEEKPLRKDDVTSVVYGTIYDGQGGKLDSVEVRLAHSKGIEKNTVSSIDGGYKFNLLIEGFYSIEINHRGFRRFKETFFLRKGEELNLNICLKVLVIVDYIKPSSIHCTVYSSKGNKIKRAMVSLFNPYDRKIVATANTDNNGYVTFRVNDSGHYILYAHQEGYEIDGIQLDVALGVNYKQKIILSEIPLHDKK